MILKRLVPPLILTAAVIVTDNKVAFGKTETSTSPLPQPDYLTSSIKVTTQSRFRQKTITVEVPIAFSVEYRDDPQLELGVEKVLQEGREGVRFETYRVIYWQGEEIDRELLKTETKPPQKRIIARGTKIVVRELPTSEYGTLRYWRKLRVWATSYDGRCQGCSGRTFSGTPVRYGTLAVDPKLIPLGTRVYIPGYGIGRAEDIGGEIKGPRIDLGFDDVRQGWWYAQWVEIYLLVD